MAKKILFTGGGTVGHVTLNLILMPKFIKDGWEIHYIGDKNGIEFKEIEKSGLVVHFHSIQTGKLRRYFSWQNVMDFFKVGFGLLQSLFIIAKIRPKALFSKGGFVSVPPVIASKLLGLPVFVHESDLSMGLANKIASKFATTLYTTFEQKTAVQNIKHIGAVTKVKKLADGKNQAQAITSQFDPTLKTLLFIGGSAGASVFNHFISDNKVLTEKYNVINITGDSTLNTSQKNLLRVDYVTDLYQPLMGIADIVITRGGSNTLFELLAMQKLHLIVPLGKEASRGDQLENADYFEQHGYARQIAEENLTIENLDKEINYLSLHKDSFIAKMADSKEIKSPDLFYDLLRADICSKTKED
ncbi:UDP-N-acetylglucosamine--N-acetylmuramyl-(pentapeptide) pyrophosphoryl-undecaprenol N-acetylglucosamine transferase [Streptococcus didelphis]|uniref:UDP-N-acetylglucosamine--N-acetylmuramyl-(Pentapeptide) pyrophosphoryl-undecaprenol N-acetylglucosamine transferase n=1 Tax=Streptococcus didelphis TaxID=102886 RepID=A0ABY9LGS2_9STRE|nr:UDP-N-acetylglucosamine--N-acetylmuramyl-(pentapeptide) pyrophosphoryl-undecaprenol N-acetylglucosamine transferase [Streptococcus didelphis]WMB28053.1 UDP-N-acetylglucosamine--N-acetylmuramyl-(pentapeptide) pyrophosphoryl-undecaprenol N-acetylglucosamine transferase [Streptococcus didelphis]WMB29965.1 UDP-N-acetylglucosamine--N-acetylmuramyl-(pentapeptide) pyrophosphoryl-undecaprenol N-acetylglucosamine transferase [Streptococcus didelphis]